MRRQRRAPTSGRPRRTRATGARVGPPAGGCACRSTTRAGLGPSRARGAAIIRAGAPRARRARPREAHPRRAPRRRAGVRRRRVLGSSAPSSRRAYRAACAAVWVSDVARRGPARQRPPRRMRAPGAGVAPRVTAVAASIHLNPVGLYGGARRAASQVAAARLPRTPAPALPAPARRGADDPQGVSLHRKITLTTHVHHGGVAPRRRPTWYTPSRRAPASRDRSHAGRSRGGRAAPSDSFPAHLMRK